MTTAALGLIVLLGAAVQRVTGMGFALVSAPLLVAVLGAHNGVKLAQVLGLIAAAVIFFAVWRNAEPKTAAVLLAAAIVGVIPGVWVSSVVPAALLTVLVGLLALASIGAVVGSARARVLRGTGGQLGAGALSGFMNVTSGLGGPPIVLYAVSTDWRHENYLATSQLYFVGLNILSLAAGEIPTFEVQTLVVALVGMVLGLLGGQLVAAKVAPEVARTLVIWIAIVGALVTITKGVLVWI